MLVLLLSPSLLVILSSFSTVLRLLPLTLLIQVVMENKRTSKLFLFFSLQLLCNLFILLDLYFHLCELLFFAPLGSSIGRMSGSLTIGLALLIRGLLPIVVVVTDLRSVQKICCAVSTAQTV